MKLRSHLYAPILFCAVLIFAGIAPLLTRLISQTGVDAFLSSTIIQMIVFLLPLAFYCKVTGFDVVSGLKFRAVSPTKIPFLLNMVLIFFVGTLLFRYFGLFFFDSAMAETPGVLQLSVKSENQILNALCAIILPAVFEEVLFRGILLEEYRPYGSAWTLAASSVMFAMLHLSMENFVYYLFMGLILGVITLASESIVPALVIHIGVNFSHEYLRPSVVEYLRQAGKSPLLPYLIVALFILLFVFMFSGLESIYRTRAYQELLQSRKELLRREVEKARAAQSEENGEEAPKRFLAFREIFLSPTFLAGVVIFVFLVSDLLKEVNA